MELDLAFWTEAGSSWTKLVKINMSASDIHEVPPEFLNSGVWTFVTKLDDDDDDDQKNDDHHRPLCLLKSTAFAKSRPNVDLLDQSMP